MADKSQPNLSLGQSDTAFTPHASMGSLMSGSMGSLLSGVNPNIIRSPRTPTPRRSLTPRQAVDILELGVTQANDLQHLFEKYLQQIDQHAINTKENIDKQFDHIIKQLSQRKDILHQQVQKETIYIPYHFVQGWS